MDPNKRKQKRRLRRKRHIRRKLRGTSERPRLSITRSLSNIYCQVIDDDRGVTLTSASSRCSEIAAAIGKNHGNRQGAEAVGNLLAGRVKELGIKKLACDRNGYSYHGRIAALADALRKEGIEV